MRSLNCEREAQALIRRILFWSHLILGLATGLMIFVMCLTGVLSAYQRQIQTYLNHRGSRSMKPSPNARPLPVDALAKRIRDAEGVEARTILIPAGESGPVEVFLGNRGIVYADPYTGAEIGRPSPAIFSFFAQVNAWHRAMGINGPNRKSAVAVMDAANVICFYLTAVGLYLWFPRKWTWKHLRAVSVFRPHLAGKARDFNWHNVIGFWMLIPLVVMVWTGVALSYRWADRVTLQALGETQRREDARPLAPAFAFGTEPDPYELRVAGLESLLEQAKIRLVGWKRIEVEIPNSILDPVNFTADLSGYGAPGYARRLQLDRDGKILSLREDSLRGRSIYRFAHTGELWGVAGQTVAMFGCVGGILLVYTGTALSVRRWFAWRTRKNKARQAQIQDRKNMRQTEFHIPALIVALGLLSTTADAQPPSRPALVAGKPYSAEENTENAKGVVSTARVFRDSQGRVRRELTILGIAGAKPRASVTISDYAAKVRYELNPETMAATRTAIEILELGSDGRREGEGHAPGHVEPPHGFDGDRRGRGEGHEGRGAENGARKHEDLGTQTVQGVSARGSRNTVTSGNGAISDESWFSPALGIEVKAIHTDPRTGATTRTLTNIKPGEPDASLFRVPAGYTLN